MAGGTGIFPFSDLIDLIFKEHLMKEKHELSEIILQQNPILVNKPFSKFTFVLLLAIHEPEDIHPITLHQLARLSLIPNEEFRVVLRIKKNE